MGKKSVKLKEFKGGIPTMDACECVENKKDVKKRLKEAKEKLKTGFDLVQYLDISYEARNQVIGSLYTNVRRIELQLERYQ